MSSFVMVVTATTAFLLIASLKPTTGALKYSRPCWTNLKQVYDSNEDFLGETIEVNGEDLHFVLYNKIADAGKGLQHFGGMTFQRKRVRHLGWSEQYTGPIHEETKLLFRPPGTLQWFDAKPGWNLYQNLLILAPVDTDGSSTPRVPCLFGEGSGDVNDPVVPVGITFNGLCQSHTDLYNIKKDTAIFKVAINPLAIIGPDGVAETFPECSKDIEDNCSSGFTSGLKGVLDGIKVTEEKLIKTIRMAVIETKSQVKDLMGQCTGGSDLSSAVNSVLEKIKTTEDDLRQAVSDELAKAKAQISELVLGECGSSSALEGALEKIKMMEQALAQSIEKAFAEVKAKVSNLIK